MDADLYAVVKDILTTLIIYRDPRRTLDADRLQTILFGGTRRRLGCFACWRVFCSRPTKAKLRPARAMQRVSGVGTSASTSSATCSSRRYSTS